MIEAAQNRKSQHSFVWNERVSDLHLKDSANPTSLTFDNISLEIDAKRAALFLQKHGLSAEQISKISLKVGVEDIVDPLLESKFVGQYHPNAKILEISAKCAAHIYNDLVGSCIDIMNNRQSPYAQIPLNSFVTDEGFVSYLKEARGSEDRRSRLTVAKKIVEESVQVYLNDTFRHEAKHAMDDNGPWIKMGYLINGTVILSPAAVISGGLLYFGEGNPLGKAAVVAVTAVPIALGAGMLMSPVAYKLNPAEYRARKFAKETGKTEDEQEIVKFRVLR